MDTKNLPRRNSCHVAEQKKIPQLLSKETDGKMMTEFVGPRAKSYAYNIEDMEKIKVKAV